MNKTNYLTGQVFGRLTVKGLHHCIKEKSFWTCECECGTIKVVSGRSLRGNSTKSCGCLRVDTTRMMGKRSKGRISKTSKNPREAHLNLIISRYKASSRNKGLEFNLTNEEFSLISTRDCHYCGESPKSRFKDYTHSYRYNGEFLYNGIDRINNEIGYAIDNCLPCCSSCNRAKHTKTYEEFTQYLNRVYKFIVSNTYE